MQDCGVYTKESGITHLAYMYTAQSSANFRNANAGKRKVGLISTVKRFHDRSKLATRRATARLARNGLL